MSDLLFEPNDHFNASDSLSLPWTAPYTNRVHKVCKIHFVCLRSKHTAWIFIPFHYSCLCDSMDFNRSWVRTRCVAQQAQREISIGFFPPWIIPLKIQGQTFSCHILTSFHSTSSSCLHKYWVPVQLEGNTLVVFCLFVFLHEDSFHSCEDHFQAVFIKTQTFELISFEVTITHTVTVWQHSRLTEHFSNQTASRASINTSTQCLPWRWYYACHLVVTN